MPDTSEYDVDIKQAGQRGNAPVQDAIAQRATDEPASTHVTAVSADAASTPTSDTMIADVSTTVDDHHSRDSVTSAHSSEDDGSTSHEDSPATDDHSSTDDHVATDEATVEAPAEVWHADVATHDATTDGATDQQG